MLGSDLLVNSTCFLTICKGTNIFVYMQIY
nr:MAG TPA_asm: hypothetical protein [Caudoviricetes sp.]